MRYNQTNSKISRFARLAFLFIALVLFSMPVQAQNEKATVGNLELPGTSKIFNKVPARVPLKIEFENTNATDLLQAVRIKVTNNSNKPIYFVFLDIISLDVLSPRGVKYSFPIKYGRQELVKPSALPEESDIPILPGESQILILDGELLEGWTRLRGKLGLPLPLLFDLRLQHISHGDGSGYFGSTGAPFSGRYPTDEDGKLIKNVLAPQSESKKKVIESLENRTRPKSSIAISKIRELPKSCSSPTGVTASFFSQG